MAEKYKGVGRKLQIGEEVTYGTLADMETNLNYLSESLKLDVTKEAEESLLAAKTINGVVLRGYNVSGDFSLNLKPENLSIFKYFFKEAADPTTVTTGVYKHTLVLLAPTDVQPSFSAIVDRGAAVQAYTGLMGDSLSFEGSARSPISLKVTVKGKGEEVTGTIDTELPDPSLDTFNAIGGTVTMGGSTIGDITKASLDVSMGLDDGEATYGSGLYNTQQKHGLKEVKSSFDGFYNSTTNPIREADYKVNAYIAETIEWVSSALIAPTYPYKIKLTMPKVSINDASPTVSGKDTIKITIGGTATSNGGSEPLTLEIWDNVATKY